jgi:hypothetical protein
MQAPFKLERATRTLKVSTLKQSVSLNAFVILQFSVIINGGSAEICTLRAKHVPS